jgi:DNA-binding CsgD family transcriptional regulator
MGRVEEGFALLDEAMVAVTSGELSPMMTGLIYCSVIACCQRIHELGRAREWTAALGRWCEDQRQMMLFTSTCMVHRAEILQLQGAWAAALAEARRACEPHADGIDERPPGAAFYQQGEVLRLRGELDAAEKAYRSASRAGAEPHPGLALLWLARGRTRAAAAAIGRALDETVEPLARARLLPARVDILLAGRDHEGARAACDELAEITARFRTDVLRATAAQAQGALELAAGNPREALVRLRLAWKEWQALEIPHAAARTREMLGLACRALGDRAGGRMELEAARAAYESLGAGPDIARVDALLAHRPDAGAHGLTPREVQVLRLVAAGKSNKEVADALSLSVKTVERHVGNILTKLDVSSRVAATAWAYENEVVRPPG